MLLLAFHVLSLTSAKAPTCSSAKTNGSAAWAYGDPAARHGPDAGSKSNELLHRKSLYSAQPAAAQIPTAFCLPGFNKLETLYVRYSTRLGRKLTEGSSTPSDASWPLTETS